MKVGMVSPYDYGKPGGVGEHVRHLAAELRNRGTEVKILAPSAGKHEAAVEGLYPLGRPIPVPANGSGRFSIRSASTWSTSMSR